MRVLIIDGYVDEPACLGVPPYIAPYPRYIAGALVDKGVMPEDIFYRTIDQLRQTGINEGFDLVVIVAGMTVPGKYLRATPISLKEIRDLSYLEGIKVIGGPVRLGFGEEGGSSAKEMEFPGLTLAEKDIEAFVHDIADDGVESARHRMRTNKEIAEWGVKGSFIIRQHPDFPYVMCELETYRGCPRHSHCSFCTEPFYGRPDFREIGDVVREVSALYSQGARYFRIGRQPDLFKYMAVNGVPDPGAIENLYSGIREAAPDLKVLHMDNVNPATIARFPEESLSIARTIIRYHTPGDVAALGMESADPDVIRANDLKALPDEVFDAVKLLNEAGAARGSNGLPELLPGINFVHGLKGETEKTFELNFRFLKRVLDSDLMVRRVNIRQVMTFAGTPMEGYDRKKYSELFVYYKNKIREEIDMPMLRRIVPSGTVMKDVRTEVFDKITFGRQLGSYPLLVGIPAELELNRSYNIIVTGHGKRSITGVPVPININRAPTKIIKELFGKKQAQKILAGRPYRDREDLERRGGVVGEWVGW